MKNYKDTNINKDSLLLYAVTDRHWLNGRKLVDVVRESIEGGVSIVQLREKELDPDEFLREAYDIKALCADYKVPFIVNDNVEIAIASGADGVHVGQSDMEAGNVRELIGENCILGVSAQTVEQALLAEKHGADYLGVGAVFATGSKDDADSVSLETLREICEAVSIPVVAIGGIGLNNVEQLEGSGIDGISVISAIYAQENIQSAAAELRNACEKANFRGEMSQVKCDGEMSQGDCAGEMSQGDCAGEMSQELLCANGRKLPAVLTIAGSDSSGGAGIQADLKTMLANGVYGMSAITALTAQNTTGVSAILNVDPEFMGKQLDSVFTDIYPDAVKIGMVSDKDIIRVIAAKLRQYRAHNIVVDPVMVATSGARLISEDALEILKGELFPLADILTPNIPEAEELTGLSIQSTEDMVAAARVISETYSCAVLCKGGHSLNDANDLLWSDGKSRWFNGKRIDNPNTHGTGCTLSSAIASNLASGYSLEESVSRAKEYISGALAAMLDLGAGSGPMHHGWMITE